MYTGLNMSRLKVDNIEPRSGNNVAIDNPMNLKSYDTAGRNALTSATGDMIYNTTTNIPEVYNGTAWVALGSPVEIDFLVVAGGGSGGSNSTAGGGAGGLRSTIGNTGGGGSLESKIKLNTGEDYLTSVGAGGPSVSANVTFGINGSASFIASIVSIGGGGGAKIGNNIAGRDGGSGGGGCFQGAGGTGFTNQGYAGGAGGDNDNHAGSGGGGAGAVGVKTVHAAGANDATGGAGGAGVISNIITASEATTASVGEVSGSDVYYAGGGAGGGYYASSAASGGIGGGGDSAATGGAGGNGTANTGGGGSGGGSNSFASGAGGSGVIIVKYSDSYTMTVGAGLTSSTITGGGYKTTIFTAGTGTVSFS
jgi:hypothetical protein